MASFLKLTAQKGEHLDVFALECQKVAHIYLHLTEAGTYVVVGQKFSIPARCNAIIMALAICKQLSEQLCLPRLSADDMMLENVQDKSPGYGIGSQYLAEHPEAIQTALYQFIEKHSLLHLDKRAVLRVYRRFSTPLLELLLWLLHVLSGQPGRASEMVEYTLVNLPTLPRTMMKVMCTIACVPWYNKTDSVCLIQIPGSVPLPCAGPFASSIHFGSKEHRTPTKRRCHSQVLTAVISLLRPWRSVLCRQLP
ncbi:hypothetical protein MP228_008110 [Amoeboaphelidium protococcarum]|nr:hypothetical protein MP228_008110 [Amoeboaphelidium protococcarum]